MQIPVLDISPLVFGAGDQREVAVRIGKACHDCGFFYVVGHGVDEPLQLRLEQVSRQFFVQDAAIKERIRMALGGRAWRGYFPVGGELTSGKPDLKEGIYFGAELGDYHPLVKNGTPLHGANLFPDNIPLFRETVLEFMAAMTKLGHTLMAGISLSLGLNESFFTDRYTSDPLTLFRIFNYPASTGNSQGVGEHTDYGLLSIVRQDASGGLQVKTKSQWVDAVPIPNSFVCNVGDMLDRITRGRYLSAPHRVHNRSGHERLSFAFFFDPNFNAEVRALPMDANVHDNKDERWDRANVHEFQGTYGDYLVGKVSKVFPDLQRKVL